MSYNNNNNNMSLYPQPCWTIITRLIDDFRQLVLLYPGTYWRHRFLFNEITRMLRCCCCCCLWCCWYCWRCCCSSHRCWRNSNETACRTWPTAISTHGAFTSLLFRFASKRRYVGAIITAIYSDNSAATATATATTAEICCCCCCCCCSCCLKIISPHSTIQITAKNHGSTN